MEITLNHTIVPSYNNVESAKFYSRIFGFKFLKVWYDFAVVKVNSTLTLDFRTKEKFNFLHYAFKVTDQQFDEILKRIKKENISFGSGHGGSSGTPDDGMINHLYGGRGIYFRDINGHLLEMITRDYVID